MARIVPMIDRPDDRLFALQREIMLRASEGGSRIHFLRDLSTLLLDYSGVDAMEIWHCGDVNYRWEINKDPQSQPTFRVLPSRVTCPGKLPPVELTSWEIGHLWSALLSCSEQGPENSRTTAFLSRDLSAPFIPAWVSPQHNTQVTLNFANEYRAMVAVPFRIDKNDHGFLVLYAHQADFFAETDSSVYWQVAQIIGMAAIARRGQMALRERIKELTCLYGISRLAEQRELSMDEVLPNIAIVICNGMQYPELAVCRIRLEGKDYVSMRFAETPIRLACAIQEVHGQIGELEVFYLGSESNFYEEPFLPEEMSLLHAAAREISALANQRKDDQEKSRLEFQLRHADRLATIGQLAAGVAHELNEPLGHVLGYAQLAAKTPDLPPSLTQDLERIIKASLHAREIIKKLMFFARPVPPRRMAVDMNKIVEESLYFLESRCAKEGIEVIRDLAPDLPPLNGDSTQLQQVLVNLIVNAIRAMPYGGHLTIITAQEEDKISLWVRDTGVGMDEQILKQIFLPFFTTEAPGQGTGLGLAVVHGIVTAHHGTIEVRSRKGQGSLFILRFPLFPDASSAEDEELGQE